MHKVGQTVGKEVGEAEPPGSQSGNQEKLLAPSGSPQTQTLECLHTHRCN